jgi:hypothetical protein
MSIKLSSVDIQAKLPSLPGSLPVPTLRSTPLEERRTAIGRLGEVMKLGALRVVELEHATVMASERGDITCFRASGALWARDAMATADHRDEFRKWEGLVPSRVDGQRIALDRDTSARLVSRARDLLQPLDLLGKEVASETVQLEQVAQLDGKGHEIAHGVGAAAVKFEYAVGGVPVRGAGAKTQAFVEPGDGTPRFSGVFHAWRPIVGETKLKLPTVEEALGVGLLTDPELDRYSAAGHRIQITKLDFVYLALPAFLQQSHLIPAFQIEGVVSEGKLGISFHFGRFHHAAPPRAYAEAGLYAPYLTQNPDGITPRASRRLVG